MMRRFHPGNLRSAWCLGMVVASVDFRLNGQAPHPAAMQDIHSAIRWLKAHAADFDATPEGMGALGFSSGGHQVLMAGMRPPTAGSIQSPSYEFVSL